MKHTSVFLLLALLAAAVLISGVSAIVPAYADVAWTAPYDPFPEIDHPCLHCGRGHPNHGGHKDDGDGHHGPLPTVLVDCSGQTPRAARSVDEALGKVRANGTILIMPPGQGITCYGTIKVTKPVTIRAADGGGAAVLEAPPGMACLVAEIHLGDALILENVKFIARGLHEPCVQVRAGAVILRNARVDSRNTDWAFDVQDSGVLTVEESRVETDGSGVHARRAEVHLKGFEVDVEEGHEGIGLALDRTEGTVENSTFIGGNIGILASAGVRNLKIAGGSVRKTRNAMHLVPGQQGLIDVARVELVDNIDGLIVAPSTDTVIGDIAVKNSAATAIAVYGGAMRLDHNTVDRAALGIRVAGGGDYHSPRVPHEIEEILGYRQAAEIVERRGATVTDNTIKRAGVGIAVDRKAGAQVARNTIYVVPHGDCITGLGGWWWHSRTGDNTCIGR